MAVMKKTSPAMCRTCKYVGRTGVNHVECDYLGITKKRRNCPVGLCDKYEKNVVRRRRREKKE